MISSSQVALVTSSWEKVSGIKDQAADLFYDRLFTIAPEVKPMFPSDMGEQKQKLMAMLATAVAGLTNIEALIAPLKKLGAQHATYGTKDEHYDAVASALLWTLEEGLGEAFTSDVKAAWTDVYLVLASVMKSSAHERQASAA
jgi:hemoglobin-like flavoprotein